MGTSPAHTAASREEGRANTGLFGSSTQTGGLPTPLQDAQHSWTHSSPALGGQSQGTELANTGNYLLEQRSKKNPHLPLFLLAPEVASLLRVVFSSLETALTRDVAKREQPSFLTRGTRCR